MFCLSKGLCCPVGSLLVGSDEFIERSRKLRKVLGGGMRQAGIIAAPGIVALESMIDRLEEDHRHARHLAEGIAKISGIQIDLNCVQTNIICFDISGLGKTASFFISKLKQKGIFALALDEKKVRMVTHKGIEKEHVEKSIGAIESVSNELHLLR
jgi:threonine aldolase